SRAPGRCGKRRLQTDLGEGGQQRAQQGRLAGAGTAGDNGDAAGQGASERALLFGRQFEFRASHGRVQGALDQLLVHRAACVQFRDSPRDVHFGLVQACEIDGRVIVRLFDNHLTAGGELIDCLARQLGLHLERGAELTFEILEGRIDVALVGHALEQVQDRGAGALNRVARDAEFLRDGVGGAKSDAMNGAREYVRIAPYDVERVLAIELVDAPCVRGSQAVPAQKDRQLAKTGRVAPRCLDCPRNYGSDPGDFAHAFGSVVEHFAERVSEIFGDSTRERRADALYFRSE